MIIKFRVEILILIKLQDFLCSSYQINNNFVKHFSLLVIAESFMHKCIVLYDDPLKSFLDGGAIYLILDLLEILDLPLQSLYLELLNAMNKNKKCNQFLFTWKGIDKKKGFISLITKIWKDEEILIGIKRSPEGCLLDGKKLFLQKLLIF